MIPSSVVRRFLGSPRDDMRRYKRMSDRALERAADRLPVRPPIWGRLQREQRMLLIAAARHGRVAGWIDTGMGKTLASIAVARYARKAGLARRFIVLVPGNINLAEWLAERDLHSPSTSMQLLTGSSARKWDQMRESEATLTVATYGGIVRMVSDLVPSDAGSVLRLSRCRLGELSGTFDGLIMDESSADQAVQYRSSLAWRVCRRLSMRSRVRMALSATPFGRDPTPLWAQMFLVDHGEALGETLGIFRAAFFSSKINPWGVCEYSFRRSMSGELHRLLAHSSITIEADESSLPPVVWRVRTVRLPRDAAGYSDLARDAIASARGIYQEIKSAFVRMRQISSGFIGYTNDETGERAKFAFDRNPKLESLMSKVASVVPRHKMIISHEFIYSGDVICSELRRADVGYARVRSGSQSEVRDELARFKRDPRCRVLVLSNRMAQGPNLQVAKYMEIYESPVDPKSRKQLVRRIERQHSEHDRVFVTDYVSGGTYDQRVLDALREGRDLFEEIIRGRC